jgi:hypothetical protein
MSPVFAGSDIDWTSPNNDHTMGDMGSKPGSRGGVPPVASVPFSDEKGASPRLVDCVRRTVPLLFLWCLQKQVRPALVGILVLAA